METYPTSATRHGGSSSNKDDSHLDEHEPQHPQGRHHSMGRELRSTSRQAVYFLLTPT
jgi:hypothetical protein